MFRFLCRVQYNGTEYCGWMRQKNGIGIQQIIEKTFHTLFGESVEIRSCSRTDAGVHADGQIFFFDVSRGFEPQKILIGFNAIAPKDIRITRCRNVPVSFYAHHESVGKVYVYSILNGPVEEIFAQGKAWWIRKNLDTEKMQSAGNLFVGTHNFSAFQGKKPFPQNPVKTIQSVRLEEQTTDSGRFLRIIIRGDSFLKQMVRIMVGTMVEIGKGRLEPETILIALKTGDRKNAGITAPPQGLSLREILFHENPFTD